MGRVSDDDSVIDTNDGRLPTDAETVPAGPLHGAVRRTIGEFVLLSQIGEGAMGRVYRAWQPSLGREVALKYIARVGGEKTQQRFELEARALGSVEHPHLVKVFTSGSDENHWFYAMELLDGPDLERVIAKLRAARATDVSETTWLDAINRAHTEVRQREQPLGDAADGDRPRRPAPTRPHTSRSGTSSTHAESQAQDTHISQVVEIVRQVAEATRELHQAGLVHRDIKPANIVVNASGSWATLMDLSIVKQITGDRQRLTASRHFVGTLRYASPEQIVEPDKIGPGSDVYSLGVTFWELLTLQPLFGDPEQASVREMIERIINEDPKRPRKLNPNVPRDLEAIVLKCLEKDPARRYASAADLADDLARWQRFEPVVARRSDLLRAVRARFRRTVLHHAWTAHITLAILAILSAKLATESDSSIRTLDRQSEKILLPLSWPKGEEAWSAAVEIIGYDDATHRRVPELAEQLGLSQVDPRNVRSLRRLHGAIMKRLRIATPAVVTWDIVFRVPDAQHDAELFAGVDALEDAGTPVVMAFDNVDAQGQPVLVPELLERVTTGWLYLAKSEYSGNMVTGSVIAVSQPPAEAVPGLALASVAQYRHPFCIPEIAWGDQTNLYIEQLYYRPIPGRPGQRDRLPTADFWPLANVVNPKDPSWFPDGTDLRAWWVAVGANLLPDRETLAAHTTSYGEVFSLDDDELRARFAGKIVLIGNIQESRTDDRSLHLDRSGGRVDFNCYMHAGAICSILNNVHPFLCGALPEFLLFILTACTGILVGRRFRGRHPLRFTVLTSIGGVALGLGLQSAGILLLHVLISPIGPTIAFLVGALGAAGLSNIVRRVRIRPPTSSQFRQSAAYTA